MTTDPIYTDAERDRLAVNAVNDFLTNKVWLEKRIQEQKDYIKATLFRVKANQKDVGRRLELKVSAQQRLKYFEDLLSYITKEKLLASKLRVKCL